MVSILLIADNYYVNRYNIEGMLRGCADQEVELLVVNNSGDKRISEFLEHIINAKEKPDAPLYPNVVRVKESEELIFNKGAAYNKLLEHAKGEYICIYNAMATVNTGWLCDAIHCLQMVKNIGIAAIPEFFTKKCFVPVLDNNDDLINLMQGEPDKIEGIIVFRKELVSERGNFNENEGIDFLSEFAYSAAAHGRTNVYVTGQVAIDATVKGY